MEPRIYLYEEDAQSLVAWINLKTGKPRDAVKPLLLKLGYSVKKGRTPKGHDCFVSFPTKTITLHREACKDRSRAVCAASKALAHIRLHEHLPARDYRRYWHWEAMMYAALFLCPEGEMRPDLSIIRAPGCPERRIWRAVNDIARDLEVIPSVVRLALELRDEIEYCPKTRRIWRAGNPPPEGVASCL